MNYFIDCGFCVGAATKKFLRSPEYQATSHDEWKLYAFEPSPYIDVVIPGVKMQKKAVWIKYCELKMWFSGRNKQSSGSTIMRNKTTGKIDWKKPVSVKAIDFGKWLKNTVKPEDYVIVKMDIEGAEYEVLPKMIETGAIDLINTIYIEFHVKKLDMNPKDHLKLISDLKEVEGLWLMGDYIPSVKHPEYAHIENYIKLGERLVKRYARKRKSNA